MLHGTERKVEVPIAPRLEESPKDSGYRAQVRPKQAREGHRASTFPMKNKLPKENAKRASSFQLRHIPSKHSSVQGCLSTSNLPQTVMYVNYKL